MTALVGIFYLMNSSASVGQNIWLSHWSNQESDPNIEPNLLASLSR